MADRPVIPASTARRLLLHGQGLTARPDRRPTTAAVLRTIEQMGYVQIDTIHVVERAHHHILFTRFADYRPPVLDRLLARDRKVFEHWTHDAAVLPASVFPGWRHRFASLRAELDARHYFERRKIDDPAPLLARVLDTLGREGPRTSADFDPGSRPGGTWWAWKPAKAALEYLWWTGEISVARRENFHKVYDLTERVIPAALLRAEPPSRDEYLDACIARALDRLGTATTAEITDFYRAMPATETKRRLAAACARGAAVAVELEDASGGPPVAGFAHPDWRRRAERAPDPPPITRLLNPFDPALRDRKRTQRLFAFDYRFEAFTPGPKRRYGYYTLPILEGDRLVGRLDPKLHRDRAELEIRGLWWEPGTRPTRARTRALHSALDLYATQNGAESWRPSG